MIPNEESPVNLSRIYADHWWTTHDVTPTR